MNFLNVDIPVKNVPELDKGFVPLGLFFKNYQKGAAKPLCIAVERSGGQIGTYETKIYGTPEMEQADAYYVDRLVKFLLWSWGGFKVSICGDDNVAAAIRAAYSEGGSRAFDKGFMEQVYETEFIVESLPYDKKPEAVQRARIHRPPPGRRAHRLRRRRLGPQGVRRAGRRAIYSEEVVWFPKTISNPDYHFEGIMAALSTAAAKILEKGGHVDAIGVSSAGVYIDNKCMVASLFLKVGKDEFDKKVKNIYTRAAEQLSSQLGYHIPVVVANDGDVSALAGAMGPGRKRHHGHRHGHQRGCGLCGYRGQHLRLAERACLCSRGRPAGRHGGRVERRHRLRREILQPGRRHQAGPARGHRADGRVSG